MNKRKFLKQTIMASTGISIAPSVLLSACKTEPKNEENMSSIKIQMWDTIQNKCKIIIQ